MILPNELSVGLWFAAVPIWEWDLQANPQVAPEPSVAEPPPECAAPDGDEGGTTMCWVFKGYEWQPTALFESLANPAWDQWMQGRRDESDERALHKDRDRNAASRHAPVIPVPQAGPGDVAPDVGGDAGHTD